MFYRIKLVLLSLFLMLPAVVTCDQDAQASLPALEASEEPTTEAIIEETLLESSSAIVFWETTAAVQTSEQQTERTESITETVFIDPETEEETYYVVDDSKMGPEGFFSIPDLKIFVPLYSMYDAKMDESGAAGLSRGKLVLDHVTQDNFSLLETATVGMIAYLAKSDGSVKLLSCSYSGLGYFDGENYCLYDGSTVKSHSEYAALTCHEWPGIWVTLWREES